MTELFRPGLYTIPAGQPFVDLLASAVLEETGGDPVVLSSYRIFLPTRRACRSLREAFLRLGGGTAMLLPRMTPLGDLDEDEALLSDAAPVDGESDLAAPPAIAELRRILILSTLIRAFAERRGTGPQTPAQSVELARELARLLDETQTERLDFANLAGLAPDSYAGHWQQTLTFLEIVTASWPEILKDSGLLDRAVRRNRIIENQANAWAATPPPYPVIAAGSTGSVPATADLLRVIAGLPLGRVVLPGFDREMEAAEARVVGETHPQYGMLRLVDHMGVAPDQVELWPGAVAEAADMDRRRLISEALRPAETTERWRDLKPPRADALLGFELLTCPTPQEEAGVIALLMREALETPARTVALVTPDRTLARRVSSLLERWDLEVDDSAGQPLASTPVGSFLLLLAEAADAAFAPVPLLSLLKHPLSALGLSPERFRRDVRALEVAVLRGPAPAEGFDGLRVVASVLKADRRARIEQIIDRLEQALGGYAALVSGGGDISAMLTAHIAAMEALAATDEETGAARLWRGDDGEASSAFLEDMRDAADDLPPIVADDWSELLTVLLAGSTVRRRFGQHPRLSILSPMEARLQQFDQVILGGLNEQVWPPADRADPWMSRPMRRDFGLPTADRRVGLAAHDFAQLASQPDVIMTRADRRDGAPTVASRWIDRLTNLLDGFHDSDGQMALSIKGQTATYLAWLRIMDRPLAVVPVTAPAPRPPVTARPTQLSVTRVETWMRDPYAIYAEKILGLRALPELEEDPSAADYGTAIHAALEQFTKIYQGNIPPDAIEQLLRIGRDIFAAQAARPAVMAFWQPRFERIAEWFVLTEQSRWTGIENALVELRGELAIASPAGTFLLTCTADRLDRLVGGGATIIDYKTGAPPPRKEVEAGFAPQLPLEAAIARAGGFPGLGPVEVTDLEYWRVSGGEEAGKIIDVAKGAAGDLATDALEGLTDRIAEFARPETPYIARPYPAFAPKYSDYEHLSRVREWSVSDNGGGE